MENLIDTEVNIAGKFTPNEWMFIADSLNGVLFWPYQRFQPYELDYLLRDSQHYFKKAKKWGVKIKTISAKVMRLTGAETNAVISRVEKFWDNCHRTNVDEWAKY